MRLKKDNVEREVSTKEAAEKLIKDGYKEVTVTKIALNGLKVSDLRALAKERGIEGCAGMKKEELLELLEESEEQPEEE